MASSKLRRYERGRCGGVRITLFILTGFIALTAIGGGVAMLTGLDQFPLEWLAGTPFTSYTVPALLLTLVGASSLVAAATVFREDKLSAVTSMIAGALMAGYIAVEVLVLEQTPPGPHWTEILYFSLGVLVFVLGLYLRRTEVRLTSREEVKGERHANQSARHLRE